MELLLTQHEADDLIASLKKLTQKTTRIAPILVFGT